MNTPQRDRLCNVCGLKYEYAISTWKTKDGIKQCAHDGDALHRNKPVDRNWQTIANATGFNYDGTMK